MPCIICFPRQEVWSCSTQATTRTGISDSFPLFLGLHHVLPEHGIQHACRTEKKAQLKELCWIRNNGFQNLNSSQQDRISLPPQLHFLIAVMDTTKFFIYRETRYENIQFLIANFSWFCGQSQAFLLFLLGMQYGQTVFHGMYIYTQMRPGMHRSGAVSLYVQRHRSSPEKIYVHINMVYTCCRCSNALNSETATYL